MKGMVKLMFITALLAGCQPASQPHTTERAFYYWKSVLDLGAAEKQAMDSLKTQKLYIKFFDVVWDVIQRRPMPVAQVQFNSPTITWLQGRHTSIVPTVFITNECMQSIDSTQISALAANLQQLISSIAATQHLETAIPEIQIDCDWTAGTKDHYFSLLQKLQQYPFIKSRTLSATIRLYQCKYKQRTGIPPVNKGLLMCYNMGNLKNPATKNSIIEAEELAKYITNLEEYPLSLDIALPIFDWKVLYRNNTYTGLLRDLPDTLLQQPGIAQQAGNTYTLLRDTVLNGYTIKMGDLIRKEDVNFEEVIRSTQLLRPKLIRDHFTVVLFHLDSLTLHKYPTHELEEMFDSLH